jgi:hypothetical protein
VNEKDDEGLFSKIGWIRSSFCSMMRMAANTREEFDATGGISQRPICESIGDVEAGTETTTKQERKQSRSARVDGCMRGLKMYKHKSYTAIAALHCPSLAMPLCFDR